MPIVDTGVCDVTLIASAIIYLVYCFTILFLKMFAMSYFQQDSKAWDTIKNTNLVLKRTEPVAFEIYDAAKKSDDQIFMEKCIDILKVYPKHVNTRVSSKGFTPFLRACWSGNATLVEYMLKNGADVSIRTCSGESALYLAAHRAIQGNSVWNPKLLNLLHKSGCSVNTRREHGYSVLHLAAAKGHSKLLGWLLAHGADPFATTVCGVKPIDLARIQGQYHVVNLLKVRVDSRKHYNCCIVNS